jgi:hypothetical protein
MLRSKQMNRIVTVRLPEDLAYRLDRNSKKAGVSPSQMIRALLAKAQQDQHEEPAFPRLAGCIAGPADLSSRKGFSKI